MVTARPTSSSNGALGWRLRASQHLDAARELLRKSVLEVTAGQQSAGQWARYADALLGQTHAAIVAIAASDAAAADALHAAQEALVASRQQLATVATRAAALPAEAAEQLAAALVPNLINAANALPPEPVAPGESPGWRWRGIWDPKATYARRDLVLFASMVWTPRRPLPSGPPTIETGEGDALVSVWRSHQWAPFAAFGADGAMLVFAESDPSNTWFKTGGPGDAWCNLRTSACWLWSGGDPAIAPPPKAPAAEPPA